MNKRISDRRELLKASISGLILTPLLVSKPLFAAGGGAKTSESNFVSRSQVTSTIMSGARAMGIMQVDTGIYTTDNALKTKLGTLKPVIQAKWRSALQQYVTNYYTPGNVPDANTIGTLFQRAIANEIGNTRARVLILSVIAR